MSDAVRFPLVLGIISLCSAAGLALSYTLTRDEIRFQQELRKARGLAGVLGIELDEEAIKRGEVPWSESRYEGRKGDPEPSFTVYELKDATRGLLYAAEGKAQGYSSKIHLVAGVDQGIEQGVEQATALAVKIISQLETPGLGSKCVEPEFQEQFRDLPYRQLDLIKGVPYRDPTDAESAKQNVAGITGATITSTAVVRAVELACARIRYHLEHKGDRSPSRPLAQAEGE